MRNVIMGFRLPAMVLVFGALLGTASVAVSPASAMPMASLAASRTVATEIKIVCEPDGTCVRPPRRRPVARWIYGDKVFYGPYEGPGNYGDPGSHWRRFPFFIF